jgi:hypothetical protein
VVSLNCGRCGGRDGGVSKIEEAFKTVKDWNIAYLSEFDALKECGRTTISGGWWQRWWPGPGSCSMAFLIRTSLAHCIHNVLWRGRCGMVILKLMPLGQLASSWVVVLGLHGSHDETQEEVWDDAAWLLAQAPRLAKIIAVGDWNVDQLPAQSDDPWADLPERGEHHRLRRADLSLWASAFGLQYEEIGQSFGVMGGPWSGVMACCPISRVPLGEQAALTKPSLLDYAFCARNPCLGTSLHWDRVPADHALLKVECDVTFVLEARPRRTWSPTDWT